MKKIYSGFFFEKTDILDGYHSTYQFLPGECVLPPGVKDGDKVDVLLAGEYKDDDVRSIIVHIYLPDGSIIKEQPSGTPMHVTLQANNGVSPIEGGLRPKRNGWKAIGDDKRQWFKATAGYYYGE